MVLLLYTYAYIPTHQCRSQLSLTWRVGSRVAPFHNSGCISTGDGSLGILMYKSCQHYYTQSNSLPLEAFGLNTFNHPRPFQASYTFPPIALILPVMSRFLVKYVTQLSDFLVVPCSMEDPGLCSSIHSFSRSSCYSYFGIWW